MSITEIKARLSLSAVLLHYNLVVDRHGKLHCPWHDDKTPSLQIYEATNTWTCFSGKCDAGSGDQIDFIMRYEKISKHEALLKAKQLLDPDKAIPSSAATELASGEVSEGEVLSRQAILTKFYQGALHAMSRSHKGPGYIKARGLDAHRLGIGYSGGTVGNTWSKELKASAEQMNLFKLRRCVVFAMKNQQGGIVSLYGRSIGANPRVRHFYLKGGFRGLYPAWPPTETRCLVLTESIIDAATIQQYTDYQVLALYGTNGFTADHEQAIRSLPHLEQIVLFLDGDEAGATAVEKYTAKLKELLPALKVTAVATPENEDPSSLIQSHEPEILTHLIKESLSLTDAAVSTGLTESPSTESIKPAEVSPVKLDSSNSDLLLYQVEALRITVLGGIKITGLDRLRVTLKIEKAGCLPIRHGLDLYHSGQVDGLCRKMSDTLELSGSVAQRIISDLTGELEVYRQSKLELMKPKKKEVRVLSSEQRAGALKYLKSAKLLRHTLNDLTGCGIVGETNNALIAYLCYCSRKQARPLHVLFLGSSGTGKTWLQEQVSALIPEEEKIEITSLSDNAFYYFGREELKGKLLLIEDLDGAENVLYPLRELQSKRRISKTVTIKDNKGNLKTITLRVEGPVCVSGCTTRERIYEDNANRSILLYIDESAEQDGRIMNYQKALSSGQVDEHKQQVLQLQLQSVQRLLRPVRVINPYAQLIDLPAQVFKPRRSLMLLLHFIETITFYHQYQRPLQTDGRGGQPYIESTLEDIQAAFSLMKPVLFSKSDELSKAARSFLERLKSQVKSGEVFYTQAIRRQLRLSSSTIHRHLRELRINGYIKHKGGNRMRGYEYQIVDYEEYEQLKSGIDRQLEAIIERIKEHQQKNEASHLPKAVPAT